MLRKFLGLATAIVLLSLDAGCGARSSLPIGVGEPDGGGGTGPGAGGAGGAHLDAGACDPTTFGPIVVDQADATGPIWDVETGEIVWNGTRFGALWKQNYKGHIDLLFAVIDPNTGSAIEKTKIGGFDDQTWSAEMAWNGDAFVIYWVEEDGLLRRRTMNASGEPLEAPTIIYTPGPYTYLTAVLPLGPGAGEGLHWNEQSGPGGALVPFFAIVSADGGIVQGPSKLAIEEGLDLHVFDAVRTNGYNRVAWLRQTALGPDTLRLGAFDDQGSAAFEPVLVREADSLHFAYFGRPLVALDNGGAALAFWDYYAGAHVAWLTDGGVDTIVLPKGTSHPVLARAADGALGVAVGHGESVDKLPTDLFVQIVNGDGQVEAPILASGDSESCLESYAVEAAENSFGVMWLRGCMGPGRTLSFSLLRRCPNLGGAQ